MMPEPVAHHGSIFRIRELLIPLRIQAINGLRGHLIGSGLILPRGAANAARLIAVLEDPDNSLPAGAVAPLMVLVAPLSHPEAGPANSTPGSGAGPKRMRWPVGC